MENPVLLGVYTRINKKRIFLVQDLKRNPPLVGFLFCFFRNAFEFQMLFIVEAAREITTIDNEIISGNI